MTTESPDRIRAALVGCGRISKNHFQALAQYADEVEVAAICEIDAVRRAEHASVHGVPGFEKLAEMLETIRPDLTILCTPSGLHADQAILAAKHQSHVVTEKPMATRWPDGLRMVRACDKAGVHLFVVKQNRRNSTLQMLKRAMDEGRFGRINLVQVNVFWTRPQDYYDAARWRGTWEMDGGALMNQASHYVDLLDWLIGPVATVQAMTATLGRRIEAEDTAVLNIRWRSGALGSMSVTMLTYPQNLEGSITVLGEKGTVRIGGVAVNRVDEWQFADSRDYDAQLADTSYATTSVYGFGHPLYYRNVIDVLQGKSEPETDGRQGLRSLELLSAAYLSARDGTPVSLPLQW